LVGGDRLGVIEAVKRADIIAVDGDPLKDVHALQRGSQKR
jgi:imidazolonepropionase-like amidohydrolase